MAINIPCSDIPGPWVAWVAWVGWLGRCDALGRMGTSGAVGGLDGMVTGRLSDTPSAARTP